MDEVIVRSKEQFPLFATYVEQFPDLLVRVEYDMAVTAAVFGALNDGVLLSARVLALGCDAAYRLVGLADQGGFREVAAFFYWEYEQLAQRRVFCG